MGLNRGVTEDIVDRIAERVERFGAGEKVILVGWSLGGLYARVVAQERPDLVEKVVTLGSPFSGDRRRNNNVWRLYEWVAGHPVNDPPIDKDPEVKPPVPTLAIWSRRDGIVAPAGARGEPHERDAELRAGLQPHGLRGQRPGLSEDRRGDPRLLARNGAATSGGTRSGRPVALSRIAQVVLARTRGLPSSPMNSTWRSKRAPLRRLADPGAPGHRLAGADRAQIIDLVPGHDPDIGLDMLGRRDRVPVRGRHVLDPAHPGGIVDMAELVDVLGLRGDRRSKPDHRLGMAASRPHLPSASILRRSPTVGETASSRVRAAILGQDEGIGLGRSRSRVQRPDWPPWPAPMLIFISWRLSSVRIARSRAFHLAGSQ